MKNELSRVVDSLPGLIWSTLPDGNCDFVNQRWCDYTGLQATEAYGGGWMTAIHPDDLAPLASILSSEDPHEVEARMRRFDGEYRWFLFRARPVIDAAGQVLKWCGVNTDIEDRKRSEEALRGTEALLEAEKQLLEMVAGGRSMSTILDTLCRLVETLAGECYCSIVLVGPSGTHLEHGAAPSLPATFIASIVGRAVNADTGPCAMAAYLNEPVVSPDLMSETRWATDAWCPMALAHGIKACWSTPISSTTGKVLGAFAVYYTVPRAPTAADHRLVARLTHVASIAVERAQSDAALRRSEAFLAEGQQLSLTGSFSWRVATDEITWSAQMYRIFDFDPTVAVTIDRICSRVHPEDASSFLEMIGRARTHGSEWNFDHFRLLMPDGSVRHVDMIGNIARDRDGQPEYIGAIQDVTRRKLSEEALGHARSELARVARITSFGALTASIAHEVNQPLAGIITNASTCLRMLAADPPNVEGARETTRRTIRDGNRASEVVTRLRTLFTKKDVMVEPVDLNEVAREVIALSSNELQRGRVVLRTEFADDLPCVAGDRVQLQQVILNLLLNALDAMSGVEHRQRQTVVKTALDGVDCVRLTVQDSGLGIDPRDLDKLFDAFYTTKSGGMGIGLSVSRSIIENHRGRLWADPNDGPGAKFSFTIPRAPVSVADIPSLAESRARVRPNVVPPASSDGRSDARLDRR